MRTISLTYVNSGAITKQSCSWSAGEDITFAFAPASGSIDVTGWQFRLVLADTINDPPLVDLTNDEFTVANAVTGTFSALSAAAGSFALPTNRYAGELRRVDGANNKVLAKWTNAVDANPLAAGAALAPPDYQPSWGDILGIPSVVEDLGELSLAGNALKVLRANTAADGLEFVTLAGGGDMLAANNLAEVNPALARANLGLAIGTNVQAWNQKLSDFAGLSYSGNALKILRVKVTADGLEFVDETGGSSQPLDATLTAFADLTIAANSITVGTGADAFSQLALSSNTFPARSSTGNIAAKPVTDFALTVLDDAGASEVRSTLGLGTLATQNGTFSGTSSGTNTGDQDLTGYLQKAGGTMTGALLFTDNTIDIGASGATRPRRGYFGTEVVSPLFTGALSGNVTSSSATITGGSINATPIGGSTPAAGTFTSGQFTGNLTVDGDLLVSGNTITFDTATMTVEDPLIKLGRSNSADIVDIGFYGLYTSSGAKYTGLFRDATDAKWRLFAGLQSEPTTTVDTAGTGYSVGTLVANVEGALTGNATTATTLATPRTLYGNNFDGSAALTQIIASTYGGTGNGFSKFSGPASSEKTFTLPNASATILTDNAVVTAAQGGTGVANNAASTLTISGSFATTLTISNTTSVTLPTSGTLATLAGVETFSGKTLTTPTIADGGSINDGNGNEYVKFAQTASAVNEITITNSANTGFPKIAASGSDPLVSFLLTGKGGGTVYVVDSADNTKKVGFILSGMTTGLTNNLTFANTLSRTITFPDASGTVVYKDTTDVVTNKTMIATSNVVEEITTTASSATPTPTGGSLRNFFTVTAQAATATVAAPSGSPADGNIFTVRFKASGAQSISFNSSYRFIGCTAPSSLASGKTVYLTGRYNSADSKFDVLGIATEA